ncbi:hypothetical protein ANABIO4_43640 [Bacillus subtilis]|nr:hypothetical protein ANABIO4_43640 [Bacillus subtilis]
MTFNSINYMISKNLIIDLLKIKRLRGLYLNQDCFDLIDAAFDFLKSNEIYGDIDGFAFEVGVVLLKRREVARSSKYYQKVLMAKKMRNDK